MSWSVTGIAPSACTGRANGAFPLLLAVFVLALSALALSAVPVRAEAIPLAFENGRCQFVLPAGAGPHVLIVGALDAYPKVNWVSLRTEATHEMPSLPRLRPQPARLAVVAPAGWRKWPDDKTPPRQPPASKKFFLYSGQGDLDKAASYVAVTAERLARGKNIQVYLDRNDRQLEHIAATAQDVIVTFDDEIHPWCAKHLGRALDVDQDHLFTVLLSTRLETMQRGPTALDGFVRGSDFFRDLQQPFGNACDMLYLNARLKPGPHLRTVLVHEYTHAVTLSEHFHASPRTLPEEGWISEGLAHVVEGIHCHGWTNLDYRVTAFLAETEKYPLVVPDYFTTGLWRTPGTRGCSFLFLRWCHAQAGADFPRRLTQSPLAGVPNVEAALQRDFAELFRAWTVSLVEEESWRPEHVPRETLNRRQPGAPETLWCGPRRWPVHPHGDRHDFALAATSAKFFQLRAGAADQATRVTLLSNPSSRIQVSLIPLPADQGILDAAWVADRHADSLNLHLTALGSDLTLEALAWEKVDGRNPSPALATGDALTQKLGFTTIRHSETRTMPLRRPTTPGAWVLHLRARDTSRRTAAAWATLPE